MTNSEQPYPDPVAGLMRLGEPNRTEDWPDYRALGLTEAHVQDLCRMILDRDLFWAESESDEVWSAIHAWRTLAQLQDESALPALIELLGRFEEYNDDWTREELPLVFSYFGQAAIEPLRIFLADPDQYLWSHVGAGASLAKIGERHTALRDDCVAVLSRQLAAYADQEPVLNALLIGNLIDLQGVEAAPVIEQAFAAEQVDLLVQGDWEEVQIHLGLRTERSTPPPDYRGLMAAQMGSFLPELVDDLRQSTQTEGQQQAERKAAARAEAKAKAKAKAKRKQARKQRKQQRKQK